ncbi:MAG TPA: AraC family transcriptional regulator, partial [Cellvibrionaceae bacterium]|nr:AraC family transcriptional regulator [Cellvibrionaceae bacterium]
MNNILFNTHDIVLAVCILFCAFFAVANNLSKTFSPASRNLLTVFFVLSACASFDTLVFWGDAVRYAAFALSPWLLMLFSFAAFAIGPFLYWFFRSLQQPEVKLSATDYLQLLPALLALPYLYWACLRHPIEQQQALILNFSIFSNTQVHFFAFLTLKKLIPVVYGIQCLALIYRKPSLMAGQPAALRPILQLYCGFVVLWVWGLAVHLLGQWMPVKLSDQLGVAGNYLSLALLLVIWLERSKMPALIERIQLAQLVAAPQPSEHLPATEDAKDSEVDELAARIQGLMLEQQPHLNSQITLERFAALLGEPPRPVSVAINRCFKQNFQEFINCFRIEEAKRRLQDPLLADCTVVEIAHQAGFNSKATFNRLFKQQVGVTP